MAAAELSEELYDRCNKITGSSKEGYRRIFNQQELLDLCDSEPLNSIKDGKTLIPILGYLCDNALFVVNKNATASNCWSLRPRIAAKQVKILGQDDRMVYGVIESAYDEGIWTRAIKLKLGMNDAGKLNKILNKLQSLDLIKYVSNFKHQRARMYMLSYLAPSDEVTGGSFYDAGELDETLVEELSNLIVFHVRQLSWGEEKKKRVKRERSPILVRDDEDHAQESRGRKKRKSGDGAAIVIDDIEEVIPPRKQHRAHKHSHDPETDISPTQLAFSAGHHYPSATSIHQYITNSNILRAVKANALAVEEVQHILNVLVWDEKLEEVNGGYRTVRGVESKILGIEDDEDEAEAKKRGNGLTEAPCGQCPVIDLCGTGGLISAATCVYFEQWLKREVVA